MSQEKEELTPQLATAIIAAAVAAVVPKPHRIITVQLASTQDLFSGDFARSAWAREGRRQISSSHRIR